MLKSDRLLYSIDIEKEPNVKKEIENIGKILSRQGDKIKLLTATQGIIPSLSGNTWLITLLPGKEFETNKNDYWVISTGPYYLDKDTWGDRYERAYLEAHLDKDGNILNVYYPEDK